MISGESINVGTQEL